jgi:hypothetical protein
MDSARFDGLVRRFSQTRSRRETLRSLAGAVAVGALALGEREVGADACKRDGKACKKDSQCCSDNCVGGGGGSTAHSAGTCQPACLGAGAPIRGGCSPATFMMCCNQCCNADDRCCAQPGTAV